VLDEIPSEGGDPMKRLKIVLIVVAVIVLFIIGIKIGLALNPANFDSVARVPVHSLVNKSFEW